MQNDEPGSIQNAKLSIQNAVADLDATLDMEKPEEPSELRADAIDWAIDKAGEVIEQYMPDLFPPFLVQDWEDWEASVWRAISKFKQRFGTEFRIAPVFEFCILNYWVATELNFEPVCQRIARKLTANNLCIAIQMLFSKRHHQQTSQEFGLKIPSISGQIILSIAVGSGLSAFTIPAMASTFEFSQKFLAPDGARNDLFGMSVAVDGNYALIGSWEDDDKGFESGSAYLFTTPESVPEPSTALGLLALGTLGLFKRLSKRKC